MKNKSKLIILITTICLIIITILFVINVKNTIIPNNYICIFHGKNNNITYETYVYKIDNGHDNYGFNYINIARSKSSYKIIKRGIVQWTDDVFKVAKSNNSYLYVTTPNSDKKYSINDYENMFILN